MVKVPPTASRSYVHVTVLFVASVIATLFLTAITTRFAEFPAHFPVELSIRINAGESDAKNVHYIRTALAAAHWFNAVVIPASAGVVVGFLSFLMRPVSKKTCLVTAVAFGGVIILFYGPADLAPWVGAVLFTFCLLGAVSTRGEIRAPLPRATEETQPPDVTP
jgi:hypothetical protein